MVIVTFNMPNCLALAPNTFFTRILRVSSTISDFPSQTNQSRIFSLTNRRPDEKSMGLNIVPSIFFFLKVCFCTLLGKI